MSKHFPSPSEARGGIISLKATTESQQWQINSEDTVEDLVLEGGDEGIGGPNVSETNQN